MIQDDLFLRVKLNKWPFNVPMGSLVYAPVRGASLLLGLVFFMALCLLNCLLSCSFFSGNDGNSVSCDNWLWTTLTFMSFIIVVMDLLFCMPSSFCCSVCCCSVSSFL